MATIYIDNVPYEVKEGQNLLWATLSLKLNLPYFCWHPAMGSVGACRQCAVIQYKDENDTKGRLVMACMTPAQNDARISIAAPEAEAFRARVIEWLMVNHPHDCPVCDEGGHCHLQDMTLMTGHTYRRYRFKKLSYPNQYLGPFINHEMNRCIECYRCVRYYRDYAGGDDFNVFGIHDRVYFGRHEDGTLESEFSGNLIEVCPTGVFTDKTHKYHYTRKWDLQSAPSVCVNCGLGCNTFPHERYGTLRWITNRYNGEVNGYFLCDRGRFGYEFVNSERRIRHLRHGQTVIDPNPNNLDRDALIGELSSLLGVPHTVIGIGSPRASLEANFALRRLVSPEHFFQGVSATDARLVTAAIKIMQTGPLRVPTLQEVQQADAVLILGEDVLNVAPVLALALRQAAETRPRRLAEKMGIPDWHDAAVRETIQREAKSPIFIATPAVTKLDELAAQTYRAAPEDIARLGFTVAHALGAGVPAVNDLPEEVSTLAQAIAQALRDAENPLIVAGPSLGSEAILQAAANVAWALNGDKGLAGLVLTMPECNSLGLGLLGGKPLDEAFAAVRDGRADTVVILENDLFRRADTALVEAFLDQARHVIVIDHLATPTAARAEILLPAATFAEGDGTLVNNEGRAQRFFQVFVPQGDVQESWRWATDLMVALRRPEANGWKNLDDIIAAMIEEMPVLAPVREIAPPADFRLLGQKVARQPHRYSGRTAILAHRTVHEPKPPADVDTPLSFSMEGYGGQPPPALIPRFWAPGWNSPQAVTKFQAEVNGPLTGGDPGLRLIEPAGGQPAYFKQVPPAFRPKKGEWLVVPLFHIFGSDELSMLTPGVAERASRPYLALHPDDAGRLGMAEGAEAELAFDGRLYRLPVRLEPSLPLGVAGVPYGLPGSPGITLPGRYQITREAAA